MNEDVFPRSFERHLQRVFLDHPLGLYIAGTPDNVRSFDSEKMHVFHRKNFHAETADRRGRES